MLERAKAQTQPFCEFYKDPTKKGSVDVFGYNPHSFFSFKGKQFVEVTGRVNIPSEHHSYPNHSLGWFTFSYYEPQAVEAVIMHTSRIAKRLVENPRHVDADDKELFTMMTLLDIVANVGEKGLTEMERERNRRGEHENIAVIHIHGGGKPWSVSPTQSSKDILGTMQELVDTFMEQAKDQGKHFERIILSSCNDDADTSIVIHQPGTKVYFLAGKLDGNDEKVVQVEVTEGAEPKITQVNM